MKESIRTEESQARQSVFVQFHLGVERYVIGLALALAFVDVGEGEGGEDGEVEEGGGKEEYWVVDLGGLVGLVGFEDEDESGWYGGGAVACLGAFCFEFEEPILVSLIF